MAGMLWEIAVSAIAITVTRRKCSPPAEGCNTRRPMRGAKWTRANSRHVKPEGEELNLRYHPPTTGIEVEYRRNALGFFRGRGTDEPEIPRLLDNRLLCHIVGCLESIINVVASGFGLGSVIFSAKPADESHPYGHGKIEFFSAGFEGALIIAAAVGIFYEGLKQILNPQSLPHLEQGLFFLVVAGLGNFAWA